MSVALALGQLEEAMGRLKDSDGYYCPIDAYDALVRVRELLAQEITASAARVPVALYTPITAKEVEEAAP
jgi:hypothetical protein